MQSASVSASFRQGMMIVTSGMGEHAAVHFKKLSRNGL
jgi:hypothetical protein